MQSRKLSGSVSGRGTYQRLNKKVFARRAAVSLMLAAAVSTLPPVAWAANDIWTGATDNTFANGGNWNNGIPNSGDTLVFGPAGTATALTDDLAALFNVGGFLFNSDAAAYTVTGNAVTLSGGITNNGAALETLNLAMTTSGVRTLTTTAGGGDLKLGGVLSGAGGFVVSGGGVVTLTGANTYAGGTTVNSGATLSAAVSSTANAVGTGPLALSGGTIQFTPTATTATHGLSERVFGTSGQTDTTVVNFAGTASSVATVANLASGTTVNGITTNGAAEFLGKISITNAGTYKFFTSSDDGSRIFIDGVLLVNNDGPKGPIDSGAAVTLSSGLHDIRVDYIQGSGGLGETLSWSGGAGLDVGATETTVPTTVLYTAESNATTGASNAVIIGSGKGDAVNVTASSTIDLNGGAFTQAQVGNLSLTTGTTLTVTGLSGKGLRAAGNVTLNSGAGTVGITNTPDVYLDGVVSDGGVATTLTKLGAGRLVFDHDTSANTLSSTTLDIQQGTLTLVGSSASGFNFNPIGAAVVQLNGGNLVLDTTGGGPTFDNQVNVLQNATIQDVANAQTTTLGNSTRGLSVAAGTTLTIDAIAGGQTTGTDPGAALKIAGPLTGSGKLVIASSVLGSQTSFSRGTVIFTGNTSGFTGTYQVTTGALQSNVSTNFLHGTVELSGAGSLSYLFDGNGTDTPETLSTGDSVLVDATGGNITVGRLGTTFSPYFTQAANKTAQIGTLSIGAQTLTVTNNNGYGLLVGGTTTLTGAATFNVATATGSNVVQGLTLAGPITGGFGFTKSGLGTLALAGNAGDFTGNVTVTQGVLSISADTGVDATSQLGAAGNEVVLTPGTGFTATLRATDNVTTARQIKFGNATDTRSIEVVGGKTLTLTSGFDLSTTAAAALVKNDNGTLALAGSNTGWTGGVTINAGAVLVSNAAALGTGTVTISPSTNATGAALQITNGITLANAVNLQGNNNQAFGGINGAGQLESVGNFTNATGGVLTVSFDAAIGADAGSTLNINGGINNPTTTARALILTGAGTINLNSNATAATTTANQYYSINKYGSGTLNITTAQALTPTNNLTFFAGTTALVGSGTLANGNGVAATVNPGATLTVGDATAAPVTNRLGGRSLTLLGGFFNLVGGTGATTSETLGTPTFSRGFDVITVTPDAGQQANLTFTGSNNNVAPAQNSTNPAPAGASVLFRGTGLGSAAAAGVATISDTTGWVFNGQTGAVNTTTKAIMPWALVDSSATGYGTSFATADTATSILRPLNASEYGAANTVAANNNVLLNGGVTTNVATGLTPNSITFDAGANLTVGANQFLSLSSGGILVRAGSTSSISGGVLNQTSGFSPLNIWTVGDPAAPATLATLTINSVLNGGNGITSGNASLVKAGAGTLTLSTPLSAINGLGAMSANSLSGQTVINQGTLKLAGGTNTLFANNYLEVGFGATLDLNGTSQQVFGLYSDAAVTEVPTGAGGTITSSSGTGNLVVNQDNNARNWAGNITGNVNFARSGQNTLTVYTPQTYTGHTLINAGTTTLRDFGAITATSSIDLNYATLNLDNNAGTTDLANRLGDAIPIALRGGTLNFQGRAQAASTETVGAVTLAQSNSFINSVIGGTGVSSADLTLASLNRAAGGGTVNFTAATGGLIGSSSRILINSINGASTATLGGGLTDNLIGGWAIIGTSDFASYNPTYGVGALGQVGFAGYATNQLTPTALATDNIKVSYTTASTLSADTTVNSVKFDNVALGGVTFTAGKTLTLVSGGLLNFTNQSFNIGSSVGNGNLTSGGPELFVYSQGSGIATINSVVTGAGVALVKSGSGTATLAATNTYGGGTMVDQGTLNIAATGLIPLAADPNNGLVVSGGTVTLNAAGSIAAGNIVTLNGASTLNLFGNNTITGLVVNNNGGTGNPTVTSFSSLATAGADGATGVLTIGGGGIVATSSNVGTVGLVSGRVDFGPAANTVNVDSINVNGVNDVAPLTAAFALQGVVGSAGGITKTGAGVLQLNAQDVFTGPLNVTGGGIRIGTANAGSRLAQLNLGAGGRLDLNNTATTFGSLSGSGTVFSNVGTPTLTVGFDNTSTTFSGQFSRYNDGVPNGVGLSKIGSGTLTIASAQSATTGSSGNIAVNGGTLAYSGAGAAFPSVVTATAPNSAVTFTVNTGGTLLADNASGANVNNRLGLSTAGQLTIQGGTVAVTGNAGSATSETLNSVTFQNGGGVINLAPNAAQPLAVTITTIANQNTSGSGLVQGISGAAAANGTASLAITTITPLGSQGGGLNGTTNMTVRSDLLADPSATGVGTGFLVKDTTTNLYRPLASGELNTTPATWATAQNAGIVGTAQALVATTAANSLTVGGVASLNSGDNATAFGNVLGPTGLLTLSLNTGGLLVLDGGNLTTNIGSITSNNTLQVHTVGSAVANLNSYLGIADGNGLVKADAGTLNLNKSAYFTGGGGAVVNGGTLNLNSGADNTLVVSAGSATPTLVSLQVNGLTSVVDLKGNNQIVNALSTDNALPGNGGVVTNSGAATATLSSAGGGTFDGQLAGNLAFTRTGNNTTLLTSASTYTGATTVRGGTLQLRDSGSILGSSSVAVNFGTVNIDQTGLNPGDNLNPTRIAAATPITLQGGSLNLSGGGSTTNTATFNTVNIGVGGSTVNVLPLVNQGSAAAITIGNLVRPDNQSVVNFNGFTSNTNTLGGQGFNAAGDIFVNQINGTAFTAANLANKIIGNWAIANGSTFATYKDGYGVMEMGTTVQGVVAPTFDGTDVTAATTAAQNINDGTAARTVTGAHAANSWRFSPAAAQTITLATATPVTLGAGIITNANQAIGIVGADATSTITTAGGADLVVYVNQNTTTIGVKLTGAMDLVKAGGATLTLNNPVASSNDFTGGTFVQQGTLNLSGAAGATIIPHDLTINNATVTMNTNAGQIAATSNVNINGGGVLTLTGSNTLSSVTFNNTGSSGNPTLAAATQLTLSSATPITASNDNILNTPTISGTALVLSNAAPVISASGLSPNNLAISVPITSTGGAITQNGTGSVSLSGASTFTGGYNLTAGTLIFGVATAGTVPALTSGPVGTGTLTIGDGTTILGGTALTVGNATTVAGNFTFGGNLATNNLTLSGAMNLGATGRTLTVASPAVTDTLSGVITSTATGTALTKAGPGILTLSSASNNLGGAGVTVAGGVLKNGVSNAIPNTSLLTVNAGAEYDLNNTGQISQRIAGGGVITNSGAAAQTLTVGGTSATDAATAANSTFDGVLTNGAQALNLQKVGAGNLTLTNANTFTGTVVVKAGSITVTNSNALGTRTTTVDLTNGTLGQPALHLDGSTANGPVILPAALTLSTSSGPIPGTGGVFNDAGNNTIQGNFVLTSGGGSTLISSTAGVLTLNGNLAPNTTARVLFLGGAGNGVVNGQINDGSTTNVLAGLNKTGTGTWTLNGANNYSGTTAISGGLLVANNATSAIGANSPVAVTAGGALGGVGTIKGAVTLTSGTITGGGSTTDPAQTGTLTIAAATTFNRNSTYVWKVENGLGLAAPASNTAAGQGDYDQLILNSLTFGTGGTGNYNLSIVGSGNLPASGVTQQQYVYEIAQVPNASVSNFDPSQFTVTPDNPGVGGIWSVQLDPGGLTLAGGNTSTQGLDLVYTPTPEPVVTGILGVMALALGARPRRRRRDAQAARQATTA